MALTPELAEQYIENGISIDARGQPCRGTIKPAGNFEPEKDANALYKAMKGIGTNEQALIEVVAHRSNLQRQEIAKTYKTLFGKDLLNDLKSELTSNFETLMCALFLDPVTYDAESLHHAMKGAGTSEDVLIEILCTRSNSQINKIKALYKTKFGSELERDIMSETSGYFKRFMVSCLQAHRDTVTPQQYIHVAHNGWESVVDKGKAMADAKAIYDAGARQWGTDESEFLRVLSSRNVFQLRAIFMEYEKMTKKTIVQAISDEMSGDLKTAYCALAKSAINRPLYFAEQLHDSMKGLGTDDMNLIRVVVSRSEIDLANIKEEFAKAYGKSLATWIQDDTNGDYQKTLLDIVGR